MTLLRTAATDDKMRHDVIKSRCVHVIPQYFLGLFGKGVYKTFVLE